MVFVYQNERATFPLNVSAEYFKRKNNPKYFFHEERFLQLPGLNADIDQIGTVEVARALSKDVEVVGTNMTSALATFTSGGGCTVTTAGADNDQAIVVPHADALITALDDMLWKTANQPYISANIITGASIAATTIWLGFQDGDGGVGETTPAGIIGTPADQFGFMYSSEGASTTTEWSCVSSRAGVDTETVALRDADVSTSAEDVAASTLYRFEAYLDKDLIPTYAINGIQVATADNTALGSVTDVKFCIGVHAHAAAAKAITVRNFAVSQLYG